jgi:hypothetical protein
LFAYEECPRKAKFKYVDKLPEPGPKSDHLVKGELLHGEMEWYIKGAKTQLVPELSKMQTIADELREGFRRGEVRVEIELAVRRDWSVTSWFAKDAWGRFKLDIMLAIGNIGRVIDWKSGKYKPDGEYSDQLNAYSTAALSVTPTLEEMTSALVFLEHTPVPVERPEGTVHRDNLKKQQDYWTERAARMECDTVFAPRPSRQACYFCPFSAKKGGPCEF